MHVFFRDVDGEIMGPFSGYHLVVEFLSSLPTLLTMILFFSPSN